MGELPLYSDQVMKQEQYKDLLREAVRYREIKAVTPTEPELPPDNDTPRRWTMVNLVRHIPSLGPTGHART
jgi:hypothetical protein